MDNKSQNNLLHKVAAGLVFRCSWWKQSAEVRVRYHVPAGWCLWSICHRFIRWVSSHARIHTYICTVSPSKNTPLWRHVEPPSLLKRSQRRDAVRLICLSAVQQGRALDSSAERCRLYIFRSDLLPTQTRGKKFRAKSHVKITARRGKAELTQAKEEWSREKPGDKEPERPERVSACQSAAK